MELHITGVRDPQELVNHIAREISMAAKRGIPVLYVGASGDLTAWITKINADGSVDLMVWEGEATAPKKGVPRSDDGGGHTWRPIGAE